MILRHYIFLFLTGLVVNLTIMSYQPAPGYMDADYYFAGGIQLASGRGFSEPFIWNYLESPNQIPHPSHGYWMPLASLVAAAGMKLAGSIGFTQGRPFFVILAAFVPVVTSGLSFQLTSRRNAALLAGLLAVFPGFYTPFLATTDIFGMYMVLGGLFFLISGKIVLGQMGKYKVLPEFLLGLISGFMHLARADGILWLFIALFGVAMIQFHKINPTNTEYGRKTLLAELYHRCLAVLAGYLLIMGPWMGRNLIAFGTPLSPGGSRVLWLTDYDELFAYPAEMLTPGRWLASGLANIIIARLWSLGQNLQTLLAVGGEIFLAPLILAGMWRKRADLRVRLGILSVLLTLVIMTVVFPFPGARGGMFHASAAAQPLYWALVPVGLESFIAWGVKRRGWNGSQAWRVFSVGLLGLAVLLTGLVTFNQLYGDEFPDLAWGKNERLYRRVDETLLELGGRPDDIVLVNNPPGYYVATGRSAIYTPFGEVGDLIAAAHRYSARYLLLEKDHPKGLDNLYTRPQDRPGLTYLLMVETVQIYLVEDG